MSIMRRANATPQELILHSSAGLLSEHVERHFAFDEAIDAIHFGWPNVRAYSSFHSSRTLIRALRRGPGSEEYADLQEGYRELVNGALRHAATLGWTRRTPLGAFVHFSPTGLLVVTRSGTVRTAFFLGMRHNGFVDALTEPPHEQVGEVPAHQSAERLYFCRVVRPALARIRSMPAPHATTHLAEYAVLRGCPDLAGIAKFSLWLDACRTVGWNPQEGST